MTQVLAVSTQPRSWYCIEPLVAGIAPLIQSTHTQGRKEKRKKNSRSSNPLDARQPPSIYHHRGSGGSFLFFAQLWFVRSQWVTLYDWFFIPFICQLCSALGDYKHTLAEFCCCWRFAVIAAQNSALAKQLSDEEWRTSMNLESKIEPPPTVLCLKLTKTIAL